VNDEAGAGAHAPTERANSWIISITCIKGIDKRAASMISSPRIAT
jgi:hypothetical protein